MTENEASKRWCAFSRTALANDGNNTLQEHQRSYNRLLFNDDSISIAGNTCLGSRCMHWTGTDCGFNRGQGAAP